MMDVEYHAAHNRISVLNLIFGLGSKTLEIPAIRTRNSSRTGFGIVNGTADVQKHYRKQTAMRGLRKYAECHFAQFGS